MITVSPCTKLLREREPKISEVEKYILFLSTETDVLKLMGQFEIDSKIDQVMTRYKRHHY